MLTLMDADCAAGGIYDPAAGCFVPKWSFGRRSFL
jgi:hypothetical protein